MTLTFAMSPTAALVGAPFSSLRVLDVATTLRSSAAAAAVIRRRRSEGGRGLRPSATGAWPASLGEGEEGGCDSSRVRR